MKRLLLTPLGVLLLSLSSIPSAASTTTPVAVGTAANASQETSREWIAAGDALRAQRKWGEALHAYEQASKLNGGDPASRVWELRCWMEVGRINDALDGIDALSKEGVDADTLDYLYGMAFVRKAEINVAAGITDSSVAMNFGDAVDLLAKATAADGERFSDAFAHLAQAAYNSQRNEVARAAAVDALAHFPKDPKNHLLLGRIALSQFVVARGDGSPAEAADAHWSAAVGAFKKGAELLGKPTEPAAQGLLASFHTQLGYTYGWKPEHADQAADAFGKAIEWDPAAIDYGQVWGLVGIDRFIEVATAATERFVARAGDEDARVATPLWFLGHAHFQKEDWEKAEEAFATSVKMWPAYSGAWFYIGRSRYARGEHMAAIEAFRQHWLASPEGLIETVRSEPELNVAILDWLVGKAVEAGNNLDAAFLSEVCAEAVKDEPRFWNNLGLFLRDEGEKMLRTAANENVEERKELFERSYAAYSRALQLRPDDPALLNDTALMLHYHLKHDLDKAAEMYRRAHERATEELAREDLSEELRSLYEIAKRDAKNNLALLESELADS